MAERRKHDYKASDIGSQTNRRSSKSISIRKQKKEMNFMIKRRQVSQSFNNDNSSSVDQQIHSWSPKDLEDISNQIKNLDTNNALHVVRKLRIILSAEDAPTTHIISKNIVPIIIQLLGDSNAVDELKVEAAWCLCNIAAGEQEEARHSLGAVPYLIQFLNGSNEQLQEQAIWVIGNIAGDSDEFRDVLKSNGVVLPLIKLLNDHQNIAHKRKAAWALSNIARGQISAAKLFHELGLFEILMHILQQYDDLELLTEVVWILTFLTPREDEYVNKLVQLGCVDILINILTRLISETTIAAASTVPLYIPIIRSLGNFVSGEDPSWLKSVIEHQQFLPVIKIILERITIDRNKIFEKRALLKEIIWVLSNVVSSNDNKHRHMVADQGIILQLLEIFRICDFDIQRETAFAILNFCSDGIHLQWIIQQPDVLETFVKFLKVSDMELLNCSLNFMELILKRIPNSSVTIEEHGGFETIDELQYGTVEESLRQKASFIVDTYFADDDDNDGYDDGHLQNQNENQNQGSSFSFSSPALPNQGFDFNNFGNLQQNNNNNNMNDSRGRGRGRGMVIPAWMANANK